MNPEELMNLNENEAMVVLKGDPEAIDALLSSIMGMADAADEKGDDEVADSLTEAAKTLLMLRAAQYEGFQNYWLANSRAFELSFKKNLDAGDDFQDAWMKTLEEWSDSLLSDQSEFLGEKLSKTAQYEGVITHWLANSRAFELAVKKKLKDQPGLDLQEAWTSVLDEYQEDTNKVDFASENMKQASDGSGFSSGFRKIASSSGKTMRAAYESWKSDHAVVIAGFIGEVNEKIGAGEHPAVAFHETMEDYSSGRKAGRAIEAIKGVVKEGAI